MILRDPPGDGSYSFFAENTTSRMAMRLYSELSGSLKTWAEAKLGVEQDVGIGVAIPFKLWGSVKGTFEVGGSMNTQTELSLEIRNSEVLNSEYITITNIFTGESIPVQVECYQNKLIIIPLTHEYFEKDTFEVSVAKVADLYGNEIQESITWQFEIREKTNFTSSDTEPLPIHLFEESLKVYPNPFSSSTTLEFSLATAEKIHVSVFSMTGELMKITVNELLPAR